MAQRGRPRKDAVVAEPKPLDKYNNYRSDSWSNSLIGLNNKQDKSQYTRYGSAYLLDDGTLAEMYLGDGLASRIIDIIADDMTREWIDIEGANEEDIEKELSRLNAEERFNTALRWQRLFGGALMIIGAMDGNGMETPLNPTKIKNIEYLRVLDRTAVVIADCKFVKDPFSPMFGKIEQYHVRFKVDTEVMEKKIHYSRVIPFFNDPIPDKLSEMFPRDNRYWGISSLQHIYESLRDLGGVNQSVVNILYEFMLGVFKFEGLAELLASTPDVNGKSGKTLLAERLNAISASKSIINGIVLDKEEDYTRQFATLAGLPEIIDRFMLNLTGSTSIPVTRLYGRSPAGLNATGENDLRNYYDLIESNQRNRLLPSIRSLIDIIRAWKKYNAEVKITFNSLYQVTEKEYAEIEKINMEKEKVEADKYAVLIKHGVVDPAEISRIYGYEPPEDILPDELDPEDEDLLDPKKKPDDEEVDE